MPVGAGMYFQFRFFSRRVSGAFDFRLFIFVIIIYVVATYSVFFCRRALQVRREHVDPRHVNPLVAVGTCIRTALS